MTVWLLWFDDHNGEPTLLRIFHAEHAAIAELNQLGADPDSYDIEGWVVH